MAFLTKLSIPISLDTETKIVVYTRSSNQKQGSEKANEARNNNSEA